MVDRSNRHWKRTEWELSACKTVHCIDKRNRRMAQELCRSAPLHADIPD